MMSMAAVGESIILCVEVMESQLTVIDVDQDLRRNIGRSPAVLLVNEAPSWWPLQTHGCATGNRSSGMSAFAPAFTDACPKLSVHLGLRTSKTYRRPPPVCGSFLRLQR